MPIDYTDDLRLAHVLADDADFDDVGPELDEAGRVEGQKHVRIRRGRRQHLGVGETHVRIRGAAP